MVPTLADILIILYPCTIVAHLIVSNIVCHTLKCCCIFIAVYAIPGRDYETKYTAWSTKLRTMLSMAQLCVLVLIVLHVRYYELVVQKKIIIIFMY